MTWTLLTYIRDSIKSGRQGQLLQEGIPQELIGMVEGMTLDEIEDLDQRYPALFPAVVEGELLGQLIDALSHDASGDELKLVADKYRAEHPFRGPNVLDFRALMKKRLIHKNGG
jgi:hypothetical protein